MNAWGKSYNMGGGMDDFENNMILDDLGLQMDF